MDKTTLEVLTEQELSASVGHYSSEIAGDREKALDAYYGKPRGDEKAGRSQVQSLDIADAKESIMAQMLPNITSETVVQFQAAGEDDEPAAQEEGDFVTHLIFGLNHGYLNILEAVEDSLLLKNAVARAWVEEKITTIDRKGFSPTEEEAILAGVGTDEEDAQGITRDVVDMSATNEGFEYTVRLTRKESVMHIYTVDNSNFMYSTDLTSINLDEGRATFERIIRTQSQLLEMGVDRKIVDALDDYDATNQQDNNARKTEDNQNNQQAPVDNRAMRNIECFWCEVMVDWNNDGIAELMGYWYSGGKVLLDPENLSYRSYATGTCLIQAHRYEGLSLYDRLIQVQNTKTSLLRQGIDNVSYNNHGRPIYKRGGVNTDQLTNIFPGSPIGVDNPATDVIYPQIPDMTTQIVGMMGYMDEVRSERIGSSLDIQKGEVLNNVAQGTIERQFGVKEQIAALYARNFAETFLMSIYLLVHRVARSELNSQLSAKLHGQWKEANPSEWPERSRVEISLGLSEREKTAKQVSLGGVIQTQIEAMKNDLSGIMVSMPKLYQAIIDRDRAAGIDNPEQYYIDPSSEEAKQASQQKQQAKQQQGEAQAQLQKMLFDIKEREFESERDEAFFKEYVRMIIEKMKLTGGAEIAFLNAMSIAENEVTDGSNEGTTQEATGLNGAGGDVSSGTTVQ